MGSLAYSTTYSWKVRYLNSIGVWSSYSTSTSFTTIAPPVLASDTWTGPNGGAWYTPTNWSAGEIPGDVTNVNINGSNVVVNYPFYIGSLSLNGGTLQLENGSGTEPYQVSSLAITNGGRLDVGNNGLTINYGKTANPTTAILQFLASGYASGKWTGTGIISSAVRGIARMGSA